LTKHCGVNMYWLIVLRANGYILQDINRASEPNPQSEVPRKTENTQHTFPISKGPLITSAVYFRNTTSTQYRNHSTKWCPDADPPMTDNSQLRHQQFAQSPVPVVRCIFAKQVIISPPVLQNISEASHRERAINSG
jgi:hypothetical protein